MTFYLDPRVLRHPEANVSVGATGELVWLRGECHDACIDLPIHPAFIVHMAHETRLAERIRIVPHFRACDPLTQHIALLLEAEVEGEDVAGRLYAEILANALAVHFLRRYAACQPAAQELSVGLSRQRLQRTVDYIHAHLERDLLLTELAAVGHTSLAHFARLFKQATGLAPHQFVITCRIERAKRLLAETERPIIDISRCVGFTDQSHFTALFRKHVSTTPKVYRANSRRA